MDLLAELNETQREAVQWAEGPALVLAGPGSGKTRVLTHRVAHLVRERGISPREILAVTFTNKAAREMKERLLQLLGPESDALTIGTFHSICARILRREGNLLGFTSAYSIYDTDDQLAVVKRVMREMNVDDKIHRPGAILDGISRAKNELVAPEEFRPRSFSQEIVGRIYARYQQALKQSNALDFDDLLMYVAWILQKHPDALCRYQARYTYVLVDEFQDTNMAQYVLLKLLAAERRNLFVVADEDQSIYSWRGADFRNIQRFRRDYPGARVILLERNYRSTQTILDVANAVISRNVQRIPKHLYTDRGTGTPIVVHEAYDEGEEGRFVVDTIQTMVAKKQCRAGDCAVMYRTNAQSRAMEDAFVLAGQRYKLIGAIRFYERREIKDALAYLRILHNPADSVSLSRIINVPPRGLGDQTVAALFSWAGELGCSAWDALRALKDGAESPFSARAAKLLLQFLELWERLVDASQTMSAADLLKEALEATGYEQHIRSDKDEGDERWDNIKELLAAADNYSGMTNSLSAFLEEVSLVSEVDNLEEQPDVPVLLTLHMAKGLEFSVVFIVGLEEGILPHGRSLAYPEDLEKRNSWSQGWSSSARENPEGLEEERRLFYVGVTRAKDRLHLIHAFRRSTYGRGSVSKPSRFLADVPASLMQAKGGHTPRPGFGEQRPASPVAWRSPSVVDLAGERKDAANASAEPSFRAGDRVRHPVFGEGTVVNSGIVSGDEQVTVAFPKGGVKTLVARYAKLEKVR